MDDEAPAPIRRSKALPDWPRIMRKRTAAAYLDMAVAEFDRLWAGGTLPLPFRMGRYEYWSRASIDKHVDTLTGDAEPDWRATHPLYADPNFKPPVGRRRRKSD